MNSTTHQIGRHNEGQTTLEAFWKDSIALVIGMRVLIFNESIFHHRQQIARQISSASQPARFHACPLSECTEQQDESTGFLRAMHPV